MLRRLRLRRFLGLRDEGFEFAAGLNVIVGPNEAGKSTLRTAIRTALYGNPATTSPVRREEFRTWGTEEPPELILEFEVDGKRFVLTKDFAARKVVLVDSLGRAWEQHKVVQERLVAQLGLATEELFEATAQVAQAELERIHLNSIAKELGRIVGGGGEDVAAVMRRLDQAVRAMEKGSKAPTKDPGVLKALEDRVAALRDAQQRLAASAAQAERARIELAAVRDEYATTEEALMVKRDLLEKNREMLQVEERVNSLRREEAMQERRVRQIEETLNRLAAVDRDLEATTAAGLPSEEATVAARMHQQRIALLEREITRLQRDLETPAVAPAAPRRWWVAAGIGVVFVLIGLLIRGVAQTGGTLLLAIGGLTAIGGAWKAYQVGTAHQRALARRQERERQLAALSDELAGEHVRLSERLAQTGCSSVEEAEQRLQRHRDLARDRLQLARFLEDLRSGDTDEAILERWNVVRREVFVLEERLKAPEAAARRLTPLQITALEREVDQLTQQLKQLSEKERRLAWDLERFTADADSLPSEEEQLQEAEEALVQTKHRHVVYREALAGLQEARRLAEVPVREIMQRRAGEYLRILSEGRYQRLQVDAETLGLSVWSDEAGAWVEAAEPDLSRGTVDLVYLSARLALINVLTGGKRPPLLFDDPFITFDERRRAATFTLLRELSETYQVFLFTYTRYYDDVADRVIELPDRTEAAPSSLEPEVRVTPVGPLWERPHQS